MRNAHRSWIAIFCALAVLAVLGTRVLFHRRTSTLPPAGIPDLALTSPLNQPGGGAAPPEAYEPYSALYQVAMDEPLVFVADSDTDIPQLDGSCLRPSNPQEQAMNDAFVHANEKSHRWQRTFAIPSGYQLISRAEAGQIFSCLDLHGQAPESCARYKDVRHVRFLGVPGFDPSHSRALVSVIRKCGSRCGSGGIFVVEKAGGTWRRADTTEFTRNCSWMY